MFAGQTISSRSAIVCAPRTGFVIEAAHKKGAGSTKNGRDSESKRRGVKVYGGQPVKAGGIIFRQTGSTVSATNGAATESRMAGCLVLLFSCALLKAAMLLATRGDAVTCEVLHQHSWQLEPYCLAPLPATGRSSFV